MVSRWKQWMLDLYHREDGATAVEYAVMLALIIIVCLTAISTLGNNANNTFKTLGAKLGAKVGAIEASEPEGR